MSFLVVSLPKPMLLVSQAVQVGHVMNVDIADTEHSGWIPSTGSTIPQWLDLSAATEAGSKNGTRTTRAVVWKSVGAPSFYAQKMIPEDDQIWEVKNAVMTPSGQCIVQRCIIHKSICLKYSMFIMFTLFHHFHPGFFVPSPRLPGSELVVPLFDTSRKCLGAASQAPQVHNGPQPWHSCNWLHLGLNRCHQVHQQTGRPGEAMPSHGKRQWPSTVVGPTTAMAQLHRHQVYPRGHWLCHGGLEGFEILLTIYLYNIYIYISYIICI